MYHEVRREESGKEGMKEKGVNKQHRRVMMTRREEKRMHMGGG